MAKIEGKWDGYKQKFEKIKKKNGVIGNKKMEKGVAYWIKFERKI